MVSGASYSFYEKFMNEAEVATLFVKMVSMGALFGVFIGLLYALRNR